MDSVERVHEAGGHFTSFAMVLKDVAAPGGAPTGFQDISVVADHAALAYRLPGGNERVVDQPVVGSSSIFRLVRLDAGWQVAEVIDADGSL
ncbi:hypothetical protein G9H72_04540 [Motilibacter sp. K478]|nr:hypothetical protein [Motilibacter aurantiacus]